MSEHRIRRPVAVALTAGLLLVTLAAGSLRLVDAGTLVVRESALFGGEPQLLPPGWHVAPRGLFRLHLFPAGSADLRFGVDRPVSARTAEGAEVQAAGRLTYRLNGDRAAELFAAADGDLEGWLTDHVASAFQQLIGRPEFQPFDASQRVGLEREAQVALRALAGESGFELDGFSLDRIGFSGTFTAGAPAAEVRRKLLWLAVDAFDWDVIQPLIDEGRMPNLAKLVARGSSGNLQTISPVLSPVIWTSAATGKRPEKHGIVDFVASDPATGAVIPVTSTLRKTEAYWNILSDAGLSVGVIAWWATFPAEQVNGFICTDRIAYQLFKEQLTDLDRDDPLKTHPPTLYREIAPLIVEPATIADADLTRYIDMDRYRSRFDEDDRSRVNDLRTVLAATRTYDGMGQKLFAERPTDVRVLYLEAPDTAAHVFMSFMPPAGSGVDPERVEWFGKVVPEIYAYTDELIGRYVDRFADDETTILITSDHGFKVGEERPATDARIGVGQAADWHTREGVIVLAGPDVKPGARILGASVLDLVPTILALYGMPVGEDMDGKVLTAALELPFLEEHPLRTVATYDRGDRSGQPQLAEFGESEQELLKKLESLGYIQQDMPTAHINSGTIALESGDWPTAIKELELALASDDRDPVRMNLARALRLDGDLDAAEEQLLRLSSRNWEPARVLTERSILERERGRIDSAKSLLQQALDTDPTFAEAHLHSARIFELAQDWKQAEQAYRSAIEIDPALADAHNQLGVMLQRQGRMDEAIAAFQKTIELNPDRPAPYNNIGLLHRAQERPEEARRVIELGLTMAPKSGILLNSLGTLDFEAGNVEAALKSFQAAVDAEPDYADAVANLATLYQQSGDTVSAAAMLKRLLELEPARSDARLSLAMLEIGEGKTEQAMGTLQALLERAPDHLYGLMALGEVKLRAGKYSEARIHLERASAIDGNVPRVWNSLALSCLELGDDPAAKRALERSLALDANQPKVRERLNSLRG